MGSRIIIVGVYVINIAVYVLITLVNALQLLLQILVDDLVAIQ
jgi:hypothetical protein